MASKKRGGRDNFGFDDDLDFDIPDFGGDDPMATANDRKPIATGLKSAASGFGKTFTSEARLRKTITKSLPREYEEPISKAFEIKDGVRDLYNSTSSQTQEIIRESKRSIGRIARNLEPALPKKLADRLKAIGDSADSSSSRGPSKDEIEQNTINSAFAEVFAKSQEVEAEKETKRNARQILQERIDQKRHHDTTSILGSIDQSLIKLSTFQEKEGVNYMKKSLELQFRTYFIQADMLKLQTNFFEQFRNDLQAITKNTGLPDYVKKAPKEALLEHMRNQTFEALGNTLAGRRNQWIQGVFKKAGGKAKETLDRVREGASAVFDTAESMSGMYGSGMGPTKSELVGDIAGGWAGGKLQDWGAKKVRGFAKNNRGVVRTGNRWAQIAGSLPQWINNEVQNGKHSDKVPDWIRDILSMDGESSSLNLSREVDMERATQFSEKNSRSLNVVIPELLSRIHHELYVTRTGDNASGPLQYDYEKGKFVSKKERREALLGSLVSKRDVEANQSHIEGIFSQIDPKNTLDKETRNKIAESIYKANKNGAYFDRESMSSYNVLGDHHDKAGELVRKFIEDDPTGANERRLSRDFSRLGANQVEMKEHIQALINSGRHGELAELGLIDLSTGRINMDAVRRMELGTGTTRELQELARLMVPAGSGLGQAFDEPAATPATSERSEAFRKSAFFKKQGGFIKLGGNKKKPVNAGTAPGDFQESVKQFTEALNDLKEVRGSGKATGDCCDKIEKAIQEASGKTELQEIRDILKRIEANGLGPGGPMTPEMLEAYMKNQATGFFGKAGQLVGRGVKGIFGAGMKSAKRLTTIGTGLFNKGKGAASWGMGWLSKQKDKFDLFIEGEVEPRLKKAKLEAGKYMDVSTGKIIEKYEDIKGDIRDIDTDEIVLYGSEIKNSILKNLETGKAKLGKLTGWGKSAIKTGYEGAKKSLTRLIGGAKSVYGMAWKAVGAAYEALTDGPMDVYLKDSYDTPALSKRLMSKGLYFDKETLDPITKVSDIKGAVVDNDNDVRITKEDLQNGLYDKNGKEIKTGFDRVKQFAGDSIKKAIGSYRKLIGKAKDIGSKALSWMKGLFGFDSPFTVFSKQTNDILTAIYNLLNDRMPGERSPDLDAAIASSASAGGGAGTPGKVGKAISAGWDKLKGKAAEAKGAVDGMSLESFNKHRKQVYDKMGRPLDPTLDKIEEMVNILKERLPDAKDKVFGDLDGDGVRDGSIDDLRKKRDALKEKAAGAATAAKEKLGAGAKSGYDKIAELFKSKKEEEGEGGGKDGDTYVDLGDGDGKDDKKKKGKNKKPRGRIGRGWDKLKDKLTPKGKGLGARMLRGTGRMLGGVAKFAGRLALGGISLLGMGGISGAGLVSGGLSAIGSVLGVTASALGAIIASPITVPALAIAGVGLAGYGLYKWLSNPDPKPLEKVRLVQYGWKSNDLEAYKKMKSLEEALKTAVTFKGETAEIDKEKVDIGKLMEIYGLDKSNQDHAKKFVDWFANRFRPVFLNHQALIKTTGSTKPLEDVDSNKPDIKKKYLDQCLFPGGHYSVSTSPFKDQESLYTNQYSVETEISNAKLIIDKEASDNPSGKQFAENGGGAATGLMKVKAAQQKKELAAEEKKAKEATVGVPQGNTAVRDLDKSVADQRLKAATLGTVAAASTGPGATMAKPGEGGPPMPGGADYKDVGAASAAKASSVSRANVPAPTTEQAQKVKSILIRDMPKFGINTPNQQAALLGNIEHESNFKPISENMNYKPERLMKIWPNRFPNMQIASQVAAQGPQGIANVVYGGRMGNTEPNDGWDYRGRGPIQITGKSNYSAIDKIIGKGIVKDPDKVLTDPQVSAETAMAYWKMNPALGKNADAGNFQKVRQIVNGGSIGMDDALSRTARYLDLIKNNQLPVGGTKSETSNTYDNTDKAGMGTGEPGTLVASPKPTQPNTTASLGKNPNVGPVPSSYQEPTKAVSPAQMVASPRPTASNTSLSTATVQSAPVSSVRDDFYQKKSQANTGDSISIMNDSLKETKEHTSLLRRIADGIDNLPKALAQVITETASAAPAAAPAESNNYNKPAAPLKSPSVAFRRSLAGT